MHRLILTLVLLLALIVPFALGPDSAFAESGCSYWANAPTRSGTTTRASGGFSCAIGDYGSRTIQVCLVVNGSFQRCTTAYTTGDNYSVAITCYAPAGTVHVAQSWVYFKGEDGSTYSKYSAIASSPYCA